MINSNLNKGKLKMKKQLLIIAAVTAFAFSSNVFADQRMETWQGLCHFAYDPADSDNEVYFGGCENVIDTYDAGDGQGRLAKGTSRTSAKYNSTDKTYNSLMTGGKILLKGADSDKEIYPDDEYTASNTTCEMVTSNYDAGADDNNETVYSTNDWNLEVRAVTSDSEMNNDGSYIVPFSYDLSCRGGIAQ